MTRWWAVIVCMLAASAATAQDRTRLEVYSTLEIENLNDFKKTFEAENPDIEILWNRDSTGVVTAKILAEQGAAARRCDLGSGRHLDAAARQAWPARALRAEEPRRDQAGVPRSRQSAGLGRHGSVGRGGLLQHDRGAEARLCPSRTSWFDLLDPRFKGKIAMPHPASSGTGYFHVSAWIQMFGEDKAWEFMDKLHDNIAVYEHSGTRPCRQAASGEFPLGISYELAAASARQKGAPIEGLVHEGGRRLGHGRGRHPARHEEARGGRGA